MPGSQALPLEIKRPEASESFPFGLGQGETEAICLATELGASLLLDDFDARRVAASRSIPTTGTLGVLILAHRHGHIEISTSLSRLGTTSFHMTPALKPKFFA